MPSLTRLRLLIPALAIATCLIPSLARRSSGQKPAPPAPTLEEGFRHPPSIARPRVWWHWMNGNISSAGIDLDLEWMHRVGIAGFQNFDAAFSTPQVVDRRLVYMTPPWKAAFRHAIQKGESLGFEMAIAGSPGWSESGGPWVRPSQAMKKLVWSQTHIEGGTPFHAKLAPPPTQTGPFGNLAESDPMATMGSGGAPSPIDFSSDVAVIAVRDLSEPQPMNALRPKVSSIAGAMAHPELLWDDDLNRSVSIPAAAPGKQSWLQFDFGKPTTIRSITYAPGGPHDPDRYFGHETNDGPILESSNDGTSFTPIVRTPTFGAVQHTLTFAPRTARYFRFTFTERPAPASSAPHLIAELQLHTEARVNRFEEKAAFAPIPDLYAAATQAVDTGSIIQKSDVLNLTSSLHPDGTLDWTPPPGHWLVLRFGYSLTGITNHPATPEATGPEVDKLNRADVAAYLNHYLDNYENATQGRIGKRGLSYVINDSWEAGTQNWTDAMVAEFTRRRGYDPLPWLPVMTGRIIGSAEASDRFLWDLRKTIADLVAENHYGTIAAILHERGLGMYGESHESGRATIGDGMEMKRFVDIPMSAMWVQQPGVNQELFGYDADIRESASVAHIYGKSIVAAESLTAFAAPWAWSPSSLKPTADKELAMGLNRFVLHSSVHQPLLDKAPGLTLGPFGHWFNRNEIWAEQARPWITYLSRSAWMLQQGRFVADIAYFYGEDSNLTAIFASKSPNVPPGYNFDYFNADALIHELHSKDGNLSTKSGMHYRVLVLDPYSSHMSLPVLRAIQHLVQQGATVIGDRPTGTPSLADNDQQFQTIASEMWGASDIYGKGHVLHGMPIAVALNSLAITPDFRFTAPISASATDVLFVHHKLGATDLFYVDNRTNARHTIEADLRVSGRSAELWHADTGTIEPASYKIANGRTSVPLTLEPYEAVFVVFRKPTQTSSFTVPPRRDEMLATVSGPWKVTFEANRGAPPQTELPALVSLSENPNPGIRYFSGHATYTRTIDAPPSWFHPGASLSLDLGDVANLAEVSVNGHPLGIVWKAPYRVDVTKSLTPGPNIIKVRVANLWVNRLIGDAQPDAPKHYTFTTQNPYQKNSLLVPSGLLGPIHILRNPEPRTTTQKALHPQ